MGRGEERGGRDEVGRGENIEGRGEWEGRVGEKKRKREGRRRRRGEVDRLGKDMFFTHHCHHFKPIFLCSSPVWVWFVGVAYSKQQELQYNRQVYLSALQRASAWPRLRLSVS